MKDKIYIADDEEMHRFLLREILEDSFPKYKLYEFENGKSLFESIKSNYRDISLVLTDHNMPLMNGLDVIRKCSELYPDLPIILLSAGNDLKREASSAGARDYLKKPYELDALESSIKNCLAA